MTTQIQRFSRHKTLQIVVVAVALVSAFAAAPPDACASWLSELPIIRMFHRKHDPPASPAEANEFAWKNDTITVKATERYVGAQTTLAAQNPAHEKARAAALAKLLRKVEALKVSGGIKLGLVMRRNIAVSHAVETWLAKNARVTYTDSLTSDLQSNGIISTAQAVIDLQSLVPVLKKQGITPNGLPPVQPISSIPPVV
ncbi:MAG: hypothetical protein PHX74_05295 [Candidatus Sumerlaeales bacterium]|nr:hypothetical protein [Candidatus Sumerlaeales bacterium]